MEEPHEAIKHTRLKAYLSITFTTIFVHNCSFYPFLNFTASSCQRAVNYLLQFCRANAIQGFWKELHNKPFVLKFSIDYCNKDYEIHVKYLATNLTCNSTRYIHDRYN